MWKESKESERGKKNPLDDIFNGLQNKVSESTSTNPDDQWIVWRDKAVDIYNTEAKGLGKDKQEALIRKQLIQSEVAKRDNFNLECWQKSIVDSLAHNVAVGNIARFFEVYDSGGKYNDYLEKRYPGNGYQQKSSGNPEVKAVYK